MFLPYLDPVESLVLRYLISEQGPFFSGFEVVFRGEDCIHAISQASSSLREYRLTLDRLPGVVPHSDGILSKAFLARAIFQGCLLLSSATRRMLSLHCGGRRSDGLSRPTE